MNFRKRFLPHLEFPNSTYFVTFRLAGSVPQSVLRKWQDEKQQILQAATIQHRELTDHEQNRLKYLLSSKIEQYLDQSYGECWLKKSQIASIVVNALKFFDQKRYKLHAWCVMPNHIHVVFTVISKGSELDSDLIPILHSWKSFTAHEANRVLKRSGAFWQREYYDHLIRSDEEFGFYVKYTLENPLMANLCCEWQGWEWSGCSDRIREQMRG